MPTTNNWIQIIRHVFKSLNSFINKSDFLFLYNYSQYYLDDNNVPKQVNYNHSPH